MKEQSAQQGDPTSRFCRWCKGWKQKLGKTLVCGECDHLDENGLIVEVEDA